MSINQLYLDLFHTYIVLLIYDVQNPFSILCSFWSILMQIVWPIYFGLVTFYIDFYGCFPINHDHGAPVVIIYWWILVRMFRESHLLHLFFYYFVFIKRIIVCLSILSVSEQIDAEISEYYLNNWKYQIFYLFV